MHTAHASTHLQFLFSTTPLSFHSAGKHACGRPRPACAAAGMSLLHTLPSWDSPPRSCCLACLSCGQPRHHPHSMHVVSFWRHRVPSLWLFQPCTNLHTALGPPHMPACFKRCFIRSCRSQGWLRLFQWLQLEAGHFVECFQTMLGSAVATSAVPT